MESDSDKEHRLTGQFWCPPATSSASSTQSILQHQWLHPPMLLGPALGVQLPYDQSSAGLVDGNGSELYPMVPGPGSSSDESQVSYQDHSQSTHALGSGFVGQSQWWDDLQQPRDSFHQSSSQQSGIEQGNYSVLSPQDVFMYQRVQFSQPPINDALNAEHYILSSLPTGTELVSAGPAYPQMQAESWIGPQQWIVEPEPNDQNQARSYSFTEYEIIPETSSWTDASSISASVTPPQLRDPVSVLSVPLRSVQHSAVRNQIRHDQLVKPRRRGPLDTATRDKVGEMRDMGSCWRCRKYKKSCNGPGVCDSCLIPKFKIWPSSIGCRRENLESMVRFLLPISLEEGLAMVPLDFQRGRTWRAIPQRPIPQIEYLRKSGKNDAWSLSKNEVLGTRYFDMEYLELADIAMRYQQSLPKPHKCLEASRELLIATCNWYKCIVNVPDASDPPASIVECGTIVRTATREAFRLLQQTCLSNKRTDWFPAFLSGLLITCGAVYYMDALMLMPAVAREFIWPDINNTRNDLRTKTYTLLVDLLRVSTKGINPLTMDCWTLPQTGKTTKKEEKIRAKEREVLFGSDKAALHGLLALKAWQAKHQHHLTAGKHMFVNDMVQQAKIRPIAGVWKLFEM